jgi:hypothetical protein
MLEYIYFGPQQDAQREDQRLQGLRNADAADRERLGYKNSAEPKMAVGVVPPPRTQRIGARRCLQPHFPREGENTSER